MVTEFIGRGSLFDILHTKKIVLDDERVLKIAKQMAIAMGYLHKKKILHCDMKS